MTRPPIRKFPIGPILRSYGAEVGDYRTGKQKIRCPLHDDSRPSAVVDFSANRFTCYVCNISGDALDLIVQVDHVGLASAIERAEAIAGGTTPAVQRDEPRNTPGLFSKSRARG